MTILQETPHGDLGRSALTALAWEPADNGYLTTLAREAGFLHPADVKILEGLHTTLPKGLPLLPGQSYLPVITCAADVVLDQDLSAESAQRYLDTRFNEKPGIQPLDVLTIIATQEQRDTLFASMCRAMARRAVKRINDGHAKTYYLFEGHQGERLVLIKFGREAIRR